MNLLAIFFNIGIKDFIDVFLVAILLYYFYRLMKETGSLAIFTGILVFIVLWLFVSRILEMKLLGSILDQLMSVGVLALIVIFQEEIRRFFKTLGSHRRFKKIKEIFALKESGQDDKSLYLPVVMACMNMSKQKVGALIVVEREISLDDIIHSGETFNADINQRLIENIFFKNSPLHDGAMIIRKNKIVAAACILPVSHDQSIPKNLGLRHRSALGLSEQSDALVIIVSEETGHISMARQGKIQIALTAEELEEALSQ